MVCSAFVYEEVFHDAVQAFQAGGRNAGSISENDGGGSGMDGCAQPALTVSGFLNLHCLLVLFF
jgi:hypothetical protein